MNETRKKIIDIIESFMDKTLCEGCLIDANEWVLKIHCFSKKRGYVCHDEDYDVVELVRLDWYKVIWHYDITAVLKYIDNNWYVNYNNLIDKIIVEKFPEWREVVPFYVGEISKKPLNLFSDLEEKDLLDLLLLLKQWK